LPAPGRGVGGQWFHPLMKDAGIIPTKPTKGYHTIKLEVRKDRVTVIADGAAKKVITRDSILEMDPDAAKDLDPRGAIGIWVKNGSGDFQDATITLIEGE